MRPLILVILDGLGDRVARRHMGFLSHLAEEGLARWQTLRSGLPSLSRPLYETLLTGRRVVSHGIWGNQVVRPTDGTSLFQLVQQAGGSSAMAAYSWMAELYCLPRPFSPFTDRDILAPGAPVAAGRFYWEDHYPDSHLFADAESLRRTHAPDFLLVHSMNIDDAGHRAGVDSPEYAHAVSRADALLAHTVPRWIAEGYQVAVTADHGMDSFRLHGGTTDDERLVPLWLHAPDISTGYVTPQGDQTGLCAALALLMGLEPAPSMARSLPLS